MTKKKWLYVLGIIVLITPVLFFYNAFNGNPLSKFVATKSLEKYLSTTYPTDEFNVKKPFYDFKMGGYTYHIVKIGDAQQRDYEFIMTGVLGTDVSWDGVYEANQDRPLITRLTNQANEKLLNLLQEKTPEITDVEVQLEVLKGRYDNKTNWDKNFKPEKPMHVHIMLDAGKLNKEDIVTKANSIQKTLNEENYNYDSVMINANIYNEEESTEPGSVWYVKYGVPFSKDTVLTIKDIEEYEN